jgi:hypothetical protein
MGRAYGAIAKVLTEWCRVETAAFLERPPCPHPPGGSADILPASERDRDDAGATKS